MGLVIGLLLTNKTIIDIFKMLYYNFIDFFSKLIQYSPSEASKMYEKAVNRKSVSKFNPTNTIKKLKEASSQTLSLEDRKQLIEEFLFVSD